MSGARFGGADKDQRDVLCPFIPAPGKPTPIGSRKLPGHDLAHAPQGGRARYVVPEWRSNRRFEVRVRL